MLRENVLGADRIEKLMTDFQLQHMSHSKVKTDTIIKVKQNPGKIKKRTKSKILKLNLRALVFSLDLKLLLTTPLIIGKWPHSYIFELST